MAVTTEAVAADAENGGVEVGFRSGYAIPFGEAVGHADLDEGISGAIPLWLDVGYRILPGLMVGAYAQYAFGFVGDALDKSGCDQAAMKCSISDKRVGAQVHYHFMPFHTPDPWMGAGIGYEWLSITLSSQQEDASETLRGVEFVNLQGGVDFAPDPQTRFGVGPFVSFSFAEYDHISCGGAGQTCADIGEKTVHQWLIFGVRGSFVVP